MGYFIAFTQNYAQSAVALLAEWIGTGKIRPTNKRPSSLFYEYFLLYFLATSLASEVLHNALIDECIAGFTATNKVVALQCGNPFCR
jgi:hypothetical protein